MSLPHFPLHLGQGSDSDSVQNNNNNDDDDELVESGSDTNDCDGHVPEL